MKEDKKIKQIFNMLYRSTIIVAIVLLIGYLAVYTHYYPGKKIFFAYGVPLFLFALFFSYNCLLTYFHKKGVFTSEQATDFYRMCNESGISFSGDTDMEKAEDIYFAIFGTDKYKGEGTLLSHMADIYNAGKEITEKQ